MPIAPHFLLSFWRVNAFAPITIPTICAIGAHIVEMMIMIAPKVLNLNTSEMTMPRTTKIIVRPYHCPYGAIEQMLRLGYELIEVPDENEVLTSIAMNLVPIAPGVVVCPPITQILCAPSISMASSVTRLMCLN